GVLALTPALGGRRGGGRYERLREAGELVLGEVEDVALLVGQDVVRELRRELGQPLLDGGVALLRRALQRRPVPREPVVDELDEAHLVRPEARRVTPLVH